MSSFTFPVILVAILLGLICFCGQASVLIGIPVLPQQKKSKKTIHVWVSLLLMFAPVYLIGGGYFLYGIFGAVYGGILLLPLFFTFRWNCRKILMSRLDYLKTIRAKCDRELARAMNKFCERIREVAGNDAVLLFLPEPSYTDEVQMIREALKDNQVIEKVLPCRPDEGTVLSEPATPVINAAIRQTPDIRTVIFVNAFPGNIQEALGKLEIIENPPQNSPEIIVYQWNDGNSSSSKITIYPEYSVEYLHKAVAQGNIAEVLLHLENSIYRKGEFWRTAVRPIAISQHEKHSRSPQRKKPRPQNVHCKEPSRINPVWSHAQIVKLIQSDEIRKLEHHVFDALNMPYHEDSSGSDSIYRSMRVIDWSIDDFTVRYKENRETLRRYLIAYWSFPWDPKDDESYPEGEEADGVNDVQRVFVGFSCGVSVVRAAEFFLIQSKNDERLNRFLQNRSILNPEKYKRIIKNLYDESVKQEKR